MTKLTPNSISVTAAARSLSRAASGTIHRFRGLVNQSRSRSGLPPKAPGSAPGFDFHDYGAATTPTPADRRVRITCTDYGPDRVESHEITTEMLADLSSCCRPEWCTVRWINVDGLHDLYAVHQLADHYNLHTLAVEDMLYAPQRPKVDLYGPEHGAGEQTRTFILARMIQLDQDQHITVQQISMFLGKHTVLTFLQTPSDVWQPIRDRLARTGSRLRQMDASFLVYALLDAIVDHGFPVLETYSDHLEDMESRVYDVRDESLIREVHALKHELMLLRRHFWPMRELIHQLQHLPEGTFTPNTLTYMRDVYDHAVQVLEMIESFREMSMGLVETYMSVINNRMNAVMKVLTMVAAIFIPMTFITGVYGMNFQNMPGLDFPYSFEIFCGVSLAIAGSMVLWFRKMKWL